MMKVKASNLLMLWALKCCKVISSHEWGSLTEKRRKSSQLQQLLYTSRLISTCFLIYFKRKKNFFPRESKLILNFLTMLRLHHASGFIIVFIIYEPLRKKWKYLENKKKKARRHAEIIKRMKFKEQKFSIVLDCRPFAEKNFKRSGASAKMTFIISFSTFFLFPFLIFFSSSFSYS